jgi:hypothetical protein
LGVRVPPCLPWGVSEAVITRPCHGLITGSIPVHPVPQVGTHFINFLMKELLSELNVNVSSLVRSGVVLLLGAPVVLGAGSAFNEIARATKQASQDDVRTIIIENYQGRAAEACVKYLVSKNDSKLEREAKTELDEVFGGEVNYKEVCNWTFS